MAKYRKKPVVIEATQWFRNGDHPEDNTRTIHVKDRPNFQSEGEVVRYYRRPDDSGCRICEHCGEIMHKHGWIDTAQEGHIVCPGDYVIKDDRVPRGEHGHYYPCKPDIFKAIDKPAEDQDDD